MKKFLRLGLFGFLSWLVIFGASVCLFPLKNDSEHLFEILMGFVLTTCTVALTILYFRKVHTGFLREGWLLGLAFVACNLLFDLPMFSAGPMKMPLLQYLKEIGLAYLSMPIISIGFGYVLQARFMRGSGLTGPALSALATQSSGHRERIAPTANGRLDPRTVRRSW